MKQYVKPAMEVVQLKKTILTVGCSTKCPGQCPALTCPDEAPAPCIADAGSNP